MWRRFGSSARQWQQLGGCTGNDLLCCTSQQLAPLRTKAAGAGGDAGILAETAQTVGRLVHSDAEISRLLERAKVMLSAHNVVDLRTRRRRSRGTETAGVNEYGSEGRGTDFTKSVFVNNYVNMSNGVSEAPRAVLPN